MKKLIEGVLAFRKKVRPEFRERFGHLAGGQKPQLLFIGCSDSRLVPHILMTAEPGDFFVVRNVGNLIPPWKEMPGGSEAAALEFALGQLAIPDIVVCGHSECGAMQAVEGGLEKVESARLRKWLEMGASCLPGSAPPPKFHRPLSGHNRLSQANVLRQLDHLKTHPLVKEGLVRKTLRVHGWWFDIAEADVYAYDESLAQFILIDEAQARILLDRLHS